MGLPLYGRGWMTSGSTQHGLGSPATGPITASNYTGESGSWPYFEICSRIASEQATTSVFDTNIQAAYAFTNNWWIGYEDQQTIVAKTQWAQQNGFGGVYVWDISTDDFMNMCGQGQFPLLSAILDTLTGSSTPLSSATPTTTTTTPTTTTPTTTTTTTTPTTTTTTRRTTTTPYTGHPRGYDRCDATYCITKPAAVGYYEVEPCGRNFCKCTSGVGQYLSCAAGKMFDGSSVICKVGNNTWCPTLSPPSGTPSNWPSAPSSLTAMCNAQNCADRLGANTWYTLDLCTPYWCYCTGLSATVQVCSAGKYFDFRSNVASCAAKYTLNWCGST